ncbi:hypothetical protein BPSY_2217 [Bifidobacterium psychraerophilum]|uniref:Uncharacterized protein n=1 Tax=Bifidobacterium psychraerophilum TaxID=218140 RepID=A0A087CJC9_9BIFI|nr:hypothetical protein BPSY_2217 [Bifidobacterium psychraerophilum]
MGTLLLRLIAYAAGSVKSSRHTAPAQHQNSADAGFRLRSCDKSCLPAMSSVMPRHRVLAL